MGLRLGDWLCDSWSASYVRQTGPGWQFWARAAREVESSPWAETFC